MDREMRIRVLMSAIDGASGPVKTLAQAASKAGRQLKENEKALKSLQRAQGNVESFRKIRSEIGASVKAYRNARSEAARLRAEYQALEKPTRAQARAVGQAERAANKAQMAYKLQAGRLKQLRQEFRDAGGSSRRLEQFQTSLAIKITGTTRAIDTQRAALEKLGRRQQTMHAARANADKWGRRSQNLAMGGAVTAAGGAAAASPFVEGAKQAMSFEDAIADLNKVANATPAQMRQLAAGFTELSETLPFTRAELAAIGADLKRGGVPVAELKDATRQAAELGVALSMPAEEAGQMAGKWKSAYKMTRREIQLTGDLVNELTNRYGGNVGDISGIVTRSGAFAKASGVGAGTVGALASSMNSAGVGEEIGATGVKNLLLALGKGEAATKAQRTAWKQLGLEATSMAKALRDDAGGAILLVMNRLAALPEYQQAAAMDQLFGSESIGAIAPLLTDLDGLKGRLALVSDEGKFAGSAARELNNELAKTSTQLKVAANQKNNALGALGETILPEVKEIGRFLGAMAGGLGRFAKAHPTLVKIWAVMALLAIAVGAVMVAVAAILAPFAALTVIAGALGVSIGAIMLPVLLVAAAIAAAVAAGYLLWKNWDLIKRKAGELVTWFTQLPSMFMDIGRRIVDGLVAGFRARFPFLTAIVETAATMLPAGMRQQLGIKSPSRVFAAIGGHTMEGLALGLQRGRSGALGSLRTTAAAMAAAIGASPAAAGGIEFHAPPAIGRSISAAAAAPIVINITVHAAAGADGQAIGAQVGQAAARALGGVAVSRRSFANDPDGD